MIQCALLRFIDQQFFISFTSGIGGCFFVRLAEVFWFQVRVTGLCFSHISICNDGESTSLLTSCLQILDRFSCLLDEFQYWF